MTTSRIWVIDARHYKGRPELKVEGGILRPRVERVVVGRRDCTKLVEGVIRQVELVREAVGDVPVTGAMCFIEAEWLLIGGATITRDHYARRPRPGPRRLAKLLVDACPRQVDCAYAANA